MELQFSHKNVSGLILEDLVNKLVALHSLASNYINK